MDNKESKKATYSRLQHEVLEFTEGDDSLFYSFTKSLSTERNKAKKELNTLKDVRYIKQNELQYLVLCVLHGDTSKEAVESLVSNTITNEEEITLALNTQHNLAILNSAYEGVYLDNKVAFEKLRRMKFLYKRDYKGHTRPITGIKNIERMISYMRKQKSVNLENERLKDALSRAVEDMVDLTNKGKIALLLAQGVSVEAIAKNLKLDISYVRKEKKLFDKDYKEFEI